MLGVYKNDFDELQSQNQFNNTGKGCLQSMIQSLFSSESQPSNSTKLVGYEPQTKQIDDQCPLCSQPSLQILINNALYHKYLDTQFDTHLKYTDNIINNQLCTQAIRHKQMTIEDEQEEYMRRMYNLGEYEYKNKAIVEYYKFHQDYPKLHIKGVSSIMEKYFDRKKQFQYKKVKRILKQEEDISITTQKSSSIFSDIEEDQKKSHYTDVLIDLTQSNFCFDDQANESLVLKNMCKKLDRAFQNQRLSPLNFNKKSIFDHNDNKETEQTKNFINYLKKQQERRERQQKYKNFIRSTKQSKYNSIEQQSKQYTSGTSTASNLIKKLAKVDKIKPSHSFKSANPFYDGKLFYSNSNGKVNFQSMSKQQQTKQQTNLLHSQENLEFDHMHAENGFKKNKDFVVENGNRYKNQRNNVQAQNEGFENHISNQLNVGNIKSKTNIKTTEYIYKSATQDMKVKKRAFSYNSLANTQATSKKSLAINNPVLREKDFELRNRLFSQAGKFSKDKKQPSNNQLNIKVGPDNFGRLKKSLSTNNFKTSRQIPKFYHAETIVKTQSKANQYSNRKVSVPKQVIQSLRKKSNSASKLKHDVVQRSGNQSQKQDAKQRKVELNLFTENFVKNKLQVNNLVYTHHSTKNVDIDNLLSRKLNGKVQPQKGRNHKILI